MLSLQLRMLYGLVVIGIIYVTATPSLALTKRDGEREVARSRCPFIRNSLINGRVKIRSRGRIAKFICNNGYELVGRRFATCVRGQWNNPIPICVTNGCPAINNPPNGQINVQINDALVAFFCDSGYTLKGSSTVYCNGVAWNDTAPTCNIAITAPQLSCNFEDPNICGWTHDRYHDFDWRRHQFSTPSGHVGTGPSYDHTLGKNNGGHYMYIEASSPRKVNDTARLFSPVYFPEYTPGCFVFWYHMFGATTGSLRVFLKKESQVLRELLPIWEKREQQGNLWLQGDISIPELKENFQIVLEGIRGSSYVGDTAIDDVTLYSVPCEDLVLANITRGADSCQQRCNLEEDINTTCSCKQDCGELMTCCDDYQYFCTDSANKTEVLHFSVEPPSNSSSTSNEPPLPTSVDIQTTTNDETFTPGNFDANISTSTPLTSPKVYSAVKIKTILTTSPSYSATEDITKHYINHTNISLESDNSLQNSTILLSTTSSPYSITAINKIPVTSDSLETSTETPITNVPTINDTISETLARSTQPITTTKSTSATQITDSTTNGNIKCQDNYNCASDQTLPMKSSTLPLKSTTKTTTTTTTTTIKSLPRTSSTTVITNYSLSSNVTQASTAVQSTPPKLTSSHSFTPSPLTSIATKSYSKQTMSYSSFTPPSFTPSPLTSNATKSYSKQTKSYSSYFTTSLKEETSEVTIPNINVATKRRITSKSYYYTGKVRPPVRKLNVSTTPLPLETQNASRLAFSGTSVKPVTKSRTVSDIPIKNIPSRMVTIPTTMTTSPYRKQRPTRYPFFSKPSTYNEIFNRRTTAPSPFTPIHTSTTKLTAIPCIKLTRLKIPGVPCIPIRKNYTTKVPIVTTEDTKLNISSTRYIQNYSVVTNSTNTTTDVMSFMSTEVNKNVSPSVTPTTKLIYIHPWKAISTLLHNLSTTTVTPPDTTEAVDAWKPNFKSRTKYRTHIVKPSKSPISVTLIVAVTIGSISAIVLIILVATYLSFRKRKLLQSKLSEDSEMRFLSDNEIVEFTDASSKLYSEPIS